jgi:urease accessory protein
MTPTNLTALLHLASPALPIGGFSYSQGLEAAIENGLIHDATAAHAWIASGLKEVLAVNEGPILGHLWRYWSNGDMESVRFANSWFLASRETLELKQETEQMGWSLAKLALSLEWQLQLPVESLDTIKPIALPTAFAYAAVALRIELLPCIEAYLFSWVENQVAAAIKAIPLGQIAGQRILFAMHPVIPEIASRARSIEFKDICTFAPQLSLLSGRHETQYSRLFRS